VAVSTFTLEDDAIVEPSPFLEDLAESTLVVRRDDSRPDVRVFASEALTAEPAAAGALAGEPSEWLALRQRRTPASDPRFHGQGTPAAPGSYKVSALDRFLECPFVYFAEQILKIKEEPEDEEGLSPRTQGRVLHEVFEAFFRAWQDSGHGAIVPDNLDEARQVFAAAVESRLAAMPEGDAAIERTRMMGSPVAPGFGDIVLNVEAERPTDVVERLLEYPLGGEAVLRIEGGTRRVTLRATADRIDLLSDGTFRVFDYKLTKPPDLKTAVQLPAYAAAARTRLDGHLGRSWRASDAAYVAFGKPPYYKPLAADPEKLAAALADGEARLAGVVDRIERGSFPPQPHNTHRCTYCPFVFVCRKDYVDAE
jgi:RecB family exonuclease